MKKIIFALLCLSSIILNAKPLEITMAYENENNPPYALGDGKDINFQKPGITIELLKRIEKKLDIKISFKRVPWKRGVLMLQTNHADALFHASFKQKRAEFAVYPMEDGMTDSNKAIMTNAYHLYTNKGSKLSWDGSNLINLNGKVGITKGFSIIETVKDSSKIELCNSLSSALNKLNLKSIEGVINLENRVDSTLIKYSNKYKNIQKIKTAIKTKPYYLIFSKEFYSKNKQIVEKIWAEIKTMKNNGEYNAIKAKYFYN